MNAEIADRGDNERDRIDSIAETGMTIGSDGLTRVACICVACGVRHGARGPMVQAADLSVGNCDLCGLHSRRLYPVHCWGGLRGAQVRSAGAADDTESHYGMADAARTATAGHSTQQAARSCDESAKPGATLSGTALSNRKRIARLQRAYAEQCKNLAEGLPALSCLQGGRFRDQANVDSVAMLLRSVAQDLLIAATRNDLS